MTPETDAAVKASNGQWSFVLKETCQRLERERDEAIRQRDETNTSSKYACDYNYEQKLKAERERDEARDALEYIAHAGLSARHIEEYAKEFLGRLPQNERGKRRQTKTSKLQEILRELRPNIQKT